jgi:hypothetical protein
MDIPVRLAHLPRHGGLPIPFVTGTRDGRVDFRITHAKNHELAQKFQLCGICGKHIAAPPYVFSVGPLCLAERLVFEPPMHEECALAAFTICPYLSRSDWQRKSPRDGDRLVVPEDELPAKPTRLGLARAPRYALTQNPANGMWYAVLPQEEFPVQWWSYVDSVLTPEVEHGT